MERILTAIIAIILGVATVVILNLSLTGGTAPAAFLINKSDSQMVWISEQLLCGCSFT
ncbi:MAG: hypothetical protein ACPG6P_05590 [Akkermansiaceae bacterium]